MPVQQIQPSVLRPQAAAIYLGIAESTFWKWVEAGKIPKGKRLSKRATVWRVSDLDAFIENSDEPEAKKPRSKK